MHIKRINEDLKFSSKRNTFTKSDKKKLKKYGFDILNEFSASGDYRDLFVTIKKSNGRYICRIARNGKIVWDDISSELDETLIYIKDRIDDYVDEMESYEKGSKIKRFFWDEPKFQEEDEEEY